ncbi:MAG TPA: M56 family metallopeptidase [Planctomycetaceae bacterium]|nr:M56 family metallopeptidase [Planctomycetaceae bacterium]
MTMILEFVLCNGVIAAGLFAIVYAVKSRVRSPAVLHVLWVLVLLKLLTPPLWSPTLALLPAEGPDENIDAIASGEHGAGLPQSLNERARALVEVEATDEPGAAFVDRGDPKVANAPPAALIVANGQSVDRTSIDNHSTFIAGLIGRPMLIIACIWVVGSLVWFSLAGWRIWRWQRSLRFAAAAPPTLHNTALDLARELGLRNCPEICLVPGRVSPMLWALARPARVILPAELLSELDGKSQEMLLLHELAHYRRGDHAVRWLELLSLGIYWWHPIAWLVRREIRIAEERACDAWVVALRPDSRRMYAETLVKTLGFLSTFELAPIACGVGGERGLQTRLTMIMRASSNVRLSRMAKAGFCALGLVLLPLAPSLGRTPKDGATFQVAGQAPPAAPNPLTSQLNASDKKAARVDDTLGTVVDENGKPVGGIEVAAYFNSAKVDRVFKTDEAGQFSIPGEWRSDDPFESQACLIAREGESRLGWMDFQNAAGRRGKADQQKQANGLFRIVLLPRTHAVKGTLVNSQGEPLGGIRVEVKTLLHPENYALSEYRLGNAQLAEATTAADGGFLINLPAGANARLQINDPEWKRLQIRAKPDEEDLGRFVLIQAGRIEGRVIDAKTGRPLEGEVVFAQSQNGVSRSPEFVGDGMAFTDADGKYLIGGLSPGRFNVLFGGRPPTDRAPVKVTANAVEGVEVVVGRPAHADFEAREGRRLWGKVLDGESRMPVEKIHVGYYGTARPESGAACKMVRTDADGSFEFFVPPGVSKVYIAEGDRSARADSSRTFDVPENADLDQIILRAGAKMNRGGSLEVMVKDKSSVTARVRADENATVAGSVPVEVNVKLQPHAGREVNKVEVRVAGIESQWTSMWCGQSGTGFAIPFNRNERGQTKILVVDAAGFATARSAPFVVAEQMPELRIELTAEEFVPIRGRIVDANGKGIPAASVRVARLIYGNEVQFPWGVEDASGADGRFDIKHARLGDRIRVRIEKKGTGGAESEWITLDDKQPKKLPDFQLRSPDQELGGVVLDYQGVAVADAKIMHVDEPRVEARSDAQGKFRLTGLPVGEVSLAIESAGFPREARQARAGKTDNELRVPRVNEQDRADYRMTVTLRPRDGRVVSNSRLWLCADGGELLMGLPDRKGNSHQIVFADLVRRYQSHEFAIVVAADGYAWPKPAVFPNRRNPEPVMIDLEPAAPVAIRGRVVDEDGQPVAGAKVGLSVSLTEHAADEPWRYADAPEKLPTTDVDGNFEIQGLHPNSRIAVYVNKLGYAGVWSERILIDNAESAKLPELRLPTATAEVAGRAVDEQGRPVPGAVVYYHELGRVQTTTDSSGRFRLKQVPPREIWLTVAAERGTWKKKIQPDNRDLDVVLKPQ